MTGYLELKWLAIYNFSHLFYLFSTFFKYLIRKKNIENIKTISLIVTLIRQ